MPLSLRIRVRDAGTEDRAGGGHRNLNSGHGSGTTRIPAGFPPLVYYGFTFTRPERPETEWIEFASSIESVYAVRNELEEGHRWCSFDRSRQAPRRCERWLSQVLTRDPDGLRHWRDRSESIDWEDSQGYVRDASAARDDLLTAWYALARRCFDAELLSRDEALAASPVLSVTIDDVRADQTIALPELPKSAVKIEMPARQPDPR